MRIIGCSKALHSTWFFLPTFKVLLDCGEGASYVLGTQTSDVRYIFLSHMHIDHWSGLMPIARYQKRIFFKDKRKKMATVFYHRSFLPKIQSIRKFLEDPEMRLFFHFQEIRENEEIHLRDQFYLKPFLVDHSPKHYKETSVALGMHLIERRRRLNKKFQQKKAALDKKFADDPKKAQNEFRLLMISTKQKGEEIMESYDQKLLSYCGDSRPVDVDEVKETEILMHECTFLAKDEVESAHTSLPELATLVKKSHCKNVLVYHVSDRYAQERRRYWEEITGKIGKVANIPIYVVSVDRVFSQDVGSFKDENVET